jgi:hypothetical protein
MSERTRDNSPNGPNKAQPKAKHIDHLLQQTFKDDMPSDVEMAMKKQLDRFRHKMERASTRKTGSDRRIFRGIFNPGGIRWANFLFRKEGLVVVSLLMIVLGGFIQSSGLSNQLTENLSVLGTSVVVSNQINRSHSMECSIQMPRDSQEPLHYSIQWLSPSLSKIQVKESDNEPLKTLWLSEEDIIVADHVNGRMHKERRPAQFDDPMIQPIIRYLTPTGLAERMYGEWTLEQYHQQADCRQGIFKVSLPDESALLKVTVDFCTYLPVTIKKFLVSEEQKEGKEIMNVEFTWNVPLSPEHLIPNPIKENQKSLTDKK